MVKAREQRDERVTVRLPSALKGKLADEAAAQKRSLADTIVLALEAHVARRKGR